MDGKQVATMDRMLDFTPDALDRYQAVAHRRSEAPVEATPQPVG